MQGAEDAVRTLQTKQAPFTMSSCFVRESTSLSGIGASATIAVSVGSTVWIAHVGETSAWLRRDGRWRRLTVAHTLAHAPGASADARELHGDVVLRVIGASGDSFHCDVMRVDVRAGERIAIGSDLMADAIEGVSDGDGAPGSLALRLSQASARPPSPHPGAVCVLEFASCA
jgi:serine/threonine protein phosphatase PrpC